MEDNKELQSLITKSETFSKTKDLSLALAQKLDLQETPTGEKVEETLVDALNQEKNPDKRESRRVKKKIKNIWGRYRDNVLGKLDLKNYQEYCEIQIKTAETENKLRQMQMAMEKEEAKHWLDMHKGNLQEIGYNTDSLPNKYFYSIDRYIFYLKNRFKNIPKFTWFILCGALGLAAIVALIIGLAKIL